jgi:uncharacterized protein (TIGR02145 family)
MKTKLKNRISLIVVCALLLVLAFSCKKEDGDPDTVTDIDGNVYHTITIGTRVWFKDNLKTTKFKDGSQIPLVTEQAAWTTLTNPGYCWFDNNTSNKTTYGGLYNGYAVKDARGLCPTGWHVATDADWSDMEMAFGLPQAQASIEGNRGVTENVGGHLKDLQHWDAPNSGADNSSDFSAFGTGYRRPTGEFEWFRQWTGYYTSTGLDADHLFRRYLGYDFTGVSRGNYSLHYGYSIRCVKD